MENEIPIDKEILAIPVRPNGKRKNGARSDLALEIISRKPDFLERWALLIFLGILLLLLASTWFIEYPDMIEANAVLTANHAPKEIVTRQEGRLVRLFKQNDATVLQNDIIGWIESTASHEEVIALAKQLDSSMILLATGRTDKVAGLFYQHFTHLGELQATYQQFIASYQQFCDYFVNGFYNRKKEMLQQDIFSLNQLTRTVDQQREIAELDLKLAEESFMMRDLLYNEKVISREELREEKRKLLNKQSTLPQLSAANISNGNQVRDKQKEIFQLEHDIAQQKLIFEQMLETLRSTVDDWMRKYLLRAPVDGRMAFVMPLQENMFLQTGKLLGYVVPTETTYYAELQLPQINFGKIDTGMHVQLRFNAYPYQEFGFIDSKINYISKVPSDSGFLATAAIGTTLVTNYNRPVPYKNGLKAQGIVITRNMRLLNRIYYNIIKAASVKKS